MILLLVSLTLYWGANSFCGGDDSRSANDTGVNSLSTRYADQANETNAGKVLAGKYCQSCHMLPDPALLDKENWQSALAMMAPRLGIYEHNGKRYMIHTDIDQSFYPGEPAMNAEEWQQVIDYYTDASPLNLVSQKRENPVTAGLPFFSLVLPSPLFFRKGNTASFIKIDTSVTPHRVFVNRSGSNTLFLLDAELRVLDSVVTDGPIVNMDFKENDLLACKIGANLFGDNAKQGSLIRFNRRGLRRVESLFDTLARPVQITSFDINQDHFKDYLVCEFGNLTGSLSWMENKGKDGYVRHQIRSVPGATSAYIRDYNHDGLPDIWAQFSQGEEGIFLFTNKGNGLFDEKQVVRFPPSYGSTSFELDDFNDDGSPDILYTCGDRGDGIIQLKPYHGVYVYLNNGKNEFAKQYFFPINGCIKAMAKDFDKDGDLDIAAIGFFTDNTHPEEGFTYLQNNGNFNFNGFSLPVALQFNKATTMDIGDLNDDGKMDIIIGHGFIGNSAMDDKKPLFILLKNSFPGI